MRAQSMLRSFSSPNFPQKYPSNAFCQWLLMAPNDNYVVRLDTVRMDLEATQGCIYDSITLYNGNNSDVDEKRRFCAGYFSLYSTGPYLFVVFQSDDNVEGRGFQFRFFAIPKTPPTVRSSSATISTTTETPKKGKNWVNTGVLIGGVVGGVCFVIILGLICGRCVGRGGPRQPPIHRPAAFYHSHAPPLTPLHGAGEGTTIATAVHMVQNNNAIFMVSQAMGSNISPTRFTSTITSGVTNIAFEGDEEPTGWITPMGAPGPPVGVPPPCYNDSMLVTHPPAVPPTPRRQSSVPGNSGLAPPPLFAPRESDEDPSGLDEPGPSTSSGGGQPSQPPVPTVSIEITPPELEVPQQVVETTNIQASPPAQPEPVPSTSAADSPAEASQVDEQIGTESTSSGPVTETHPSETVSNTGPAPREESAASAENSTQPEENVENCPADRNSERNDEPQENCSPITEAESCEEPRQTSDSQMCVDNETAICNESMESLPADSEESGPGTQMTHNEVSTEGNPEPSVSPPHSHTEGNPEPSVSPPHSHTEGNPEPSVSPPHSHTEGNPEPSVSPPHSHTEGNPEPSVSPPHSHTEGNPEPSVSPPHSQSPTDCNQAPCAENTAVCQPEGDQDTDTQQTAGSTTDSCGREVTEYDQEQEEICTKPSTASVDENPPVLSTEPGDCEAQQDHDSTTQCDSSVSEGCPVPDEGESLSSDHEPETAHNPTEAPDGVGSQQDISTETTPDTVKAPSDSPEEGSTEPPPLASETCETVEDASISSDSLRHRNAEQCNSLSSLPPPPPPHPGAVFDSESENFPPPPAACTVDSGGDDPQQTPSACSSLPPQADIPEPPDDDADVPAAVDSPFSSPAGLPPDNANDAQGSSENISLPPDNANDAKASSENVATSCPESHSDKPPAVETVAPSESSLNICEADSSTNQNLDSTSQAEADDACLPTEPDSAGLPDDEEPAMSPTSSKAEGSAHVASESPLLSRAESSDLPKATSCVSLEDIPVPPVADSPIVCAADEPVLPTAESPRLSPTERVSDDGVPAVTHASSLSIPEVVATSDEDHNLPVGAEASNLLPAGSASSLLQTLPGRVGEGGSQEELYAAQSFASLSSQSSPMLTERQLRNSTSVPDIKGQVNVIKREAFQRADSQ